MPMSTAASATLLPVGPALGAVIAGLGLVAMAVAALGRLGHARAVLTAGLRAAVQLGGVALVIAAVVRSGPWTAAFVLMMYAVAVWTAGRRICKGWPAAWAALPIAAAFPVAGLVLATGLLPPTGMAVIPVTGILVGGALTATSLAGQRAVEELRSRRGEVEAALALGLSSRAARLEICRPAAARALVPALDQTRTVGLVTLPGAFVGMLLGGASPVEAGAVQLFVLIGLLAVESLAIVVCVELVARGAFPAGP
ncbi:ABC transporter permease [Marinactinospora rubrisoli]|uniref:ABC transporter permease n=1 Tax=Marinactinospora rubrisoli TaxID=2715399 RepID=A0ABW2KHJ1_9ACTN